MILSRGDVAYHGSAASALDMFSGLGHYCPEYENPADFLIDVIVSAEASKDPSPRKAIVDASTAMQSPWVDGPTGPDLQDYRVST
jgi:hypothetical protein